jgi:hypothetical protein
MNGILVFNLIPQLHFSISHFSQTEIPHFFTSVYQPAHQVVQSQTLYQFAIALVYSCGIESVGG